MFVLHPIQVTYTNCLQSIGFKPSGVPQERVALDIFGPLPTSKQGNRYILGITDYFTCWAEAYSLPDQEAANMAQTIYNE